ncbi:MAG: hypothetical protein M5U26_22670 [Planctomycetota bacterium]|nr:hypothetical protein [Planctomycetota bacterium]
MPNESQAPQDAAGKDAFEYHILFCLNALKQGGGKHCAFYMDDFEGCDERTMRIIQSRVGVVGYQTKDFTDPAGKYKGFWAWHPSQASSSSLPQSGGKS